MHTYSTRSCNLDDKKVLDLSQSIAIKQIIKDRGISLKLKERKKY